MAVSEYYDADAITAMENWCANLNGGSIKVYGTPKPALNGSVGSATLLATLTFGNPAFGTPVASGGTVTATANAITAGMAVATGTAVWCALEDSSGNVAATGDCGQGSGNLNLSTTAIVGGATVSCSALTVTQPQTGS